MIQVIIGGILAILGGMLSMWFQAKNTRRIRMDEIIAEKKINANNEAFIRIKTIESMLTQSSLKETGSKMQEYEEWFFKSRLFLPGEFFNKWLALKFGISKANRIVIELPKDAEKLSQLEMNLTKIAREAIDEIYKEMKMPNIKTEKELIDKSITDLLS